MIYCLIDRLGAAAIFQLVVLLLGWLIGGKREKNGCRLGGMGPGTAALHRAQGHGRRLDPDQIRRGSAAQEWLSPARAKALPHSTEKNMRLSSLRTAILAATAALIGAGAQAGPMPTNVAAMKSMVDQSTIEVRWGGGWHGGGFGYRGVGYRGGGWGYRGGLGYRGWGYRGGGYGVAAGAIVGGAIASRSYYGGYGGYYGGGYPYSYSYAAVPYGYGGDYGYGGGDCPPYGGYAGARYYGW